MHCFPRSRWHLVFHQSFAVNVFEGRTARLPAGQDALSDTYIKFGFVGVFEFAFAEIGLARNHVTPNSFKVGMTFFVKENTSESDFFDGIEQSRTMSAFVVLFGRIFPIGRFTHLHHEYTVVAQSLAQRAPECVINIQIGNDRGNVFRIECVHNNHIERIFFLFRAVKIIEKPRKGILGAEVRARIVEAVGLRKVRTIVHERQPIARCLDHAGINLDHHAQFDRLVFQDFTDRASFSSPNNSNALGTDGVREHSRMDQRFVVGFVSQQTALHDAI
mmetsp:Transcript_6348/g.7247  ORF Transcript_6348/g.7247 Transcript_6348/m.7247 type:complete len:275 (-) Transcript_6348:2589-3413(-)